MTYRFCTERKEIINLEKIQGTTGINLWLRKDSTRKPSTGNTIVVTSRGRRVMFKVIVAAHGDSFSQYMLDCSEDLNSLIMKESFIDTNRVIAKKPTMAPASELRIWSLRIERHHYHIGHDCVVM